MCLSPASTKSFTSLTLSSVGTGTETFCSPSLGPTSSMVTCSVVVISPSSYFLLSHPIGTILPLWILCGLTHADLWPPVPYPAHALEVHDIPLIKPQRACLPAYVCFSSLCIPADTNDEMSGCCRFTLSGIAALQHQP